MNNSDTAILEVTNLVARLINGGGAVFANLLTLYCVIKFKNLHTPSCVLVASVALSDFLHGFVTLAGLPFRELHHYVCVVSITIETCTVYAQFMSFSLLAIERRHSLLVQLGRSKPWSMTKIIIACAIGWLALIACNVSFAFFNIRNPQGRLCTVGTHLPRLLRTVSICYFGVTTVVIVIFYGRLGWLVRNSNLQVAASTGDHVSFQQTQRRRADIRITKMMGMVVGLFFAAYLPLAFSLAFTIPNPPVWHHVLDHMALFIFDVNFWINPIIYSWRNLQFRKAFKKVLNRCLSERPFANITNMLGTNQTSTDPAVQQHQPGSASLSGRSDRVLALEPRRDNIPSSTQTGPDSLRY